MLKPAHVLPPLLLNTLPHHPLGGSNHILALADASPKTIAQTEYDSVCDEPVWQSLHFIEDMHYELSVG